MVWQNLNLFPWRSVIDNVAFGLEMRGMAKAERHERARALIASVGLRGFEQHLPGQLSGGMRQRVALARALIMERPILLMDEPFAALDAQTKIVMQEELLRIFDQTHKTILFVTHAIEEAILLGDEVVVMTARPGPHQGCDPCRPAAPALARDGGRKGVRRAVRPHLSSHPRGSDQDHGAAGRGGGAMTSARAARIWQLVLPTLTIVAVVAAWEALVRFRGIAPIYLPAPSSVFVYLWRMIADGSMPYHLGITLLRIFAGFALAAVCGIALGVLMGMSRTVARVADVWIAALYPLPKISLIPLLIIWVGTGEAYKIVISAVSAFFPIVISTYSGIRQTDRGLIKAAKDLGANARQIQLKVVIPGAIPSIFAGLHLGMGIAIILVVAAEMIGGSSQGGMGWLLISSGQVMETEKVFASLIVLAVVGAVVIKLQQWIDRKVAPWVNYNDG